MRGLRILENLRAIRMLRYRVPHSSTKQNIAGSTRQGVADDILLNLNARIPLLFNICNKAFSTEISADKSIRAECQ